MADKKTIRDDAPRTEPHPAGQFAAVCADVIDLGLTVEQFPGSEPQIKDKTALVFRTDEVRDGKPCHIAQEFTATMGKKGNLRKFLESWRGKPYSDDEAKQGIPLDKLEGVPCLLSIAHKTSAGGNTYAYIVSVSPLPKAMRDGVPGRDGYERGEWWAKRKAEYQAKVEAFRPAVKKNGGASLDPPNFDDFPDAGPFEDESDLPF